MNFRRDVLQLDKVTNAYRLRGTWPDSLSGLVVDRFGDTCVLEFFSAGMYKQRGGIKTQRVRLPRVPLLLLRRGTCL
ncbi:MAG: hypothetical protein U0792_23280 [Gemmataceae bacterium]